MKKILTVLLIAVMAAGFVFASVTGYARMDFKYNTENGQFGFYPTTAFNVNYKLGETAAKAGEGDVYATVEADAQLYVETLSKDVEASSLPSESGPKSVKTDFAPSVTAKIVAKDVVVTLKTARSNPVDLAKSAIDTYNAIVYGAWDNEIGNKWTVKPVSLKGGFTDDYKANGVAVDACGVKAGVDFQKNGTGAIALYEVYALSPEFAFDGAKVQAGFTVYNNEKGTVGEVSAKAAYAVDAFSATVASDIVIDKVAAEEKATAEFDIAANVAYDFVSADIYYVSDASMKQAKGYGEDNTKKLYSKYMSAQAKADLAKFNVPVTVTVTAKNLLNTAKSKTSTQDPRNFKFAVAYDGVVAADGSIKFCAVKGAEAIKYGATVSYKMDIATVAAGFEATWTKAANKATFMPTVSATSTTLVNGATVSLGWYPNTSGAFFQNTDSNLLTGKDFGILRARVQVNF